MINRSRHWVLCAAFVLGLPLSLEPCLAETKSEETLVKSEQTKSAPDKAKVQSGSEKADEQTADKSAPVSEEQTKDSDSGFKLKPGVVLPLDHWVAPREEKKKTVIDDAPDPKRAKNWSFQPQSASVKRDSTPAPKGVAPLSAQSRALRLKLAKKHGKVVDLAPIKPSNDARGKVDLKLCTVNMVGYRPKGRGKAKVVESSALSAMTKQECDVVAVQGISARTYALLWDAVEYLAAKLSRKTGLPYYGVPGTVGKRYKGSGFLINELAVDVQNASPSYSRKIGKVDFFVNTPSMIHAIAKGRDGGERSFVLVNYDLTTGSGRVQKDSVERKMLMAEFLRKYVAQLRQTIALEPRPTLVLMGNRDVPREAPAAQILSGRIRMQNIEFEECALTEDKQTIECSEMPIFPQTLFGIFSDSLIQQQELLMLKKWGRVSYYIRKLTPERYQELKNERLEQVADIYLFDSDLRLAWQHSRTPGRYAAGYEPVKNGLESSPLVWTHLNW